MRRAFDDSTAPINSLPATTSPCDRIDGASGAVYLRRIPARPPGARPVLFRSLAPLAGLALLAVAGYARWTPPARAGDLRPRPDALEYEAGARSMVRGSGYWLVVEGRRYPPRYPPGFSALLAPIFFAWDQGPGTGVVAVFVAALLGIALVMRATDLAAGPLAGLVAGVLLAASPSHVRWSRAVMSDVPSAALVALAALLLVGAVRARGTTWSLVASGVLIGLAASVRATNVLLVVPAMLVVATLGGGVRRAFVLAVACFAGLVPLLLYDVATFGRPLATGYAVWAPGMTFATTYLSAPPVGGGTIGNLPFYARELAGSGELYPWPWTLLVGLGGGCAARSARPAERAIVVLAASFLLLLVGTYALFFWQDVRFFLPALPLLVALGGLPLAPHRARATRLVGAGLLVAGAVVLARQPDLYRPDKFFDEPGVLRELAAKTERDAALLVRTNEHFFGLLLRDDAERTWIPLGPDAHLFAVRWLGLKPVDPAAPHAAWIDDALTGPFAGAQAEAAVHRLLAAGHPVYVSSLLAFQVPFYRELMDVLRARFVLERVATSARAELYRVRERAASP
jgi:hypothetical protein